MSRYIFRTLVSPSAALVVVALATASQTATAGGYPYPVVVERAPAPVLARPAESAPLALDTPAVAVPSVGTDADEATATAVARAADVPTQALPDGAAAPATFDTGLAPVAGGRAAAGAFEADRSVSLRISDDVGVVTYERDATRMGLDNARVQAAFLLSEQRDNIFTGTLLLDTRPDLVPGFRISAGSRAYAALLGSENRDVFALGLGVSAGYTLPVQVLPLELDANAFFAPDVLSFGQADRIIDWNVDVGLRLRERLSAFAGLRFLQVDTRPGSREVDDELHIGVRWTLAAPTESRPIVFD